MPPPLHTLPMTSRLLNSALRTATRASPILRPFAPRHFTTTSPKMTVHIIETASQFKETIAREKGLVVVDAFATWCGPCKAIAPVISKWSNLDEYKDKVHFTKFDVDELPELAQELGIRAMPTFVFFKDGERLTQFSGANPPALEALVKKHTFEESSPVEKEASPVEASPVGASPVGKESSPDSEKE